MLHKISAAGRLAAIVLVCGLGAQASGNAAQANRGPSQGGAHLYLLSGTATIDSIRGLPVRLYSVSSGRLALVRKVADGLFSVEDDLAGDLYVLNVGASAVSVIHEDHPGENDVVLGPKDSVPPGRFLFFYPTWGAIAGLGVRSGVVFAQHSAGWQVARILAVKPAAGKRIVPSNWGLYRYFRYAGNGGGPYMYPRPDAEIEGHSVMLPYTLAPGRGYLGPVPEDLPASAGTDPDHPDEPREAQIIADTKSAFVIDPSGAAPDWIRTIYVLNKATGRWTTMKLRIGALNPRLFGDWLAITIGVPNPKRLPSPGEENERPETVGALPRVRGMYSTEMYNPGVLELDNISDLRRIEIHTGQQDSEVLDVSAGGQVLYRVNDEIFSAQIEGDKIGPATLVVKGEDVPEVHWVFWSKAKPPSAPAATAAPAN